jgi:hypothetical protein
MKSGFLLTLDLTPAPSPRRRGVFGLKRGQSPLFKTASPSPNEGKGLGDRVVKNRFSIVIKQNGNCNPFHIVVNYYPACQFTPFEV